MASSVRPATRSLLKCSFLHHPLRSQIIPKQSPICRRQIHQSPVLNRKAGGTAVSSRGMVGTGGTEFPESPTAQRKTALADMTKSMGHQRRDMGIAPMTWINPTGDNRRDLWRGIFKRPRVLLKYIFRREQTRATNYFNLRQFAWKQFGKQWRLFKKTRRNRRNADKVIKVDKNDIRERALDLHSQMYKAFAEGKMKDIEAICMEGLSESMRQRISRRSTADVFSWETIGNRTAKPSTMKQVPASMNYKGKQIQIQQVVVKIQGKQKLLKGTKLPGKWTEEQMNQGLNIKWKEETIKDTSEYFIIQRRILALRPEKWEVWGFGQETTLDNFEETAMKTENVAALSKKTASSSTSQGLALGSA